jgi:hypothetical protein
MLWFQVRVLVGPPTLYIGIARLEEVPRQYSAESHPQFVANTSIACVCFDYEG